MISMQEVRSKYPQYEDLSDQQLADSLHKKYYSDVPKDKFYQKIGFLPKIESKKEITYNKTTDNRSLINELANNPITNTILGAGDAVNNFPRQISNLISPDSMRVPMVKSSSGLAYEGGGALGDLATFGIGGGALNSARLGAESLPIIGKAAEYLGGNGIQGIGRRSIGSGIYGAIETPENRGIGAAEGGILSSGLDTIGGAFGKIMPKRYMGEIYRTVSNGLKNVQSESKDMYGRVMNNFGEQPISLKGIDPEIFQGDSKLKKIWLDFKESPTIENAHKLQSQIGATDRKLKGVDVFTNERKSSLQDSRENILNSIRKSLGSKYPEAREMYDQATKHYRENVIPYQITNRAIRKIVDPTPEKVVRKLDAVTKMDSYPKNKSDNGEIPFVPRDISDVGEELSNRIRNRNVAKTAGGFTLGGQIGKAVGAPFMGEVMGAYLGSKSADPFRKISSKEIDPGRLGVLQSLYNNLIGGDDLKKDFIKSYLLSNG